MMKRPRWQYCLICISLFLVSNSFAGEWLPTKMETDAQADGVIDSIIYYVYDADGTMIESKVDNDADGTMDSITYNTYNSDGYSTIAEQDLDADGTIDLVLYSSTSTDGKKIILEYDTDANGTIDSFYYSSSDDGCPMMTLRTYEGTGAYDGAGNLTSISYNTYDDNCNVVKEEDDDDLDGQIDEVTYITYDEECHATLRKVDSDNDGDFETIGQYTFDSQGFPLRSEIDVDMESYGITVTGTDIYDFENTYDGNGNAVKIETNLHATRTIAGATTSTDTASAVYNTYEYFENVESAESDDCHNSGCCQQTDDGDTGSAGTGAAPVSMGVTGSFEANDPVTLTVSASETSGETLYYKFFYRANYGTAAYNSSPWVIMQDYSAANTCQYTFPGDGSYIVVARVVTDPANEPANLPIIGGVVIIGDSVHPKIGQLSSNVSGAVSPNSPVTFTITASDAGANDLYYKWFYRAGYGTPNYESMPWVTVQGYSQSTSCQITFPDEGDYIVVVRAVTNPANEPVDLPIIGATVTCSE